MFSVQGRCSSEKVVFAEGDLHPRKAQNQAIFLTYRTKAASKFANVSFYSSVIYWSESYGNYIFPKIYKASISGENVEEFVTEQLEYPVSLAMDQPSGRLFWADKKKHSIESISTDGSRLRLTTLDYRKDEKLQFPISIDVFEDYVYGMMEYTGQLFKVHKFGKEAMTILKADLRKTFQVKLFHNNRHLPPNKGLCQ